MNIVEVSKGLVINQSSFVSIEAIRDCDSAKYRPEINSVRIVLTYGVDRQVDIVNEVLTCAVPSIWITLTLTAWTCLFSDNEDRGFMSLTRDDKHYIDDLTKVYNAEYKMLIPHCSKDAPFEEIKIRHDLIAKLTDKYKTIVKNYILKDKYIN